MVAEAANGEQVFDILCQMEIDLVLLDMLMPGISGPELINDIRLQEKNPPILVLSAHHEVQVARRALQAGLHCDIRGRSGRRGVSRIP